MFNTIKDLALESVASLMAFFYSLPVVGGSYGLAIIMLTGAVMVVLMPLTIKATRSTIKMTQLQPELRALQKEYKDNKPELNQAMMALYQEHGVNPVGGCLPMLAQLPVFLILFNVLRGLTRRVSEKPYFAVSERARELTGAQETSAQTFDPKYLDKESALYQDLSVDTEMLFGPFDLAVDAWQVVQNNPFGSLPYILLILFVVGSSYYQQRQVSARRGAVPDNPTPQQQTQQQLLRILPLMSGVWSFLFPAGLVLYWATSNLFRIGQQAYITQALYRGDGPGGDSAVDELEKSRAEKAKESEEESAKSGKSGKDGAANGAASDDSLIGDGRPGRKGSNRNGSSKSQPKSGSKSGSGSESGSGSKSNDAKSDSGSKNGSSADVDRDEAWARRRAQRTKAKASKQKSTTDGSSRTTPKGTKPPASKKKRKR
ncbi:MAG: membrane protein insertase YidC [Acidimicrobiales bacterium]